MFKNKILKLKTPLRHTKTGITYDLLPHFLLRKRRIRYINHHMANILPNFGHFMQFTASKSHVNCSFPEFIQEFYSAKPSQRT